MKYTTGARGGGARSANQPLVLLPLLAAGSLMTIGALIVAKVAHVAMRRLGLELYGVLFWLGLTETPADELSARRQRTPAGARSPRRDARRREAPSGAASAP